MTYTPSQVLVDHLALLDSGDVDVVITMLPEAADWARGRGYRVRAEVRNGVTVYEIWPAESGQSSSDSSS